MWACSSHTIPCGLCCNCNCSVKNCPLLNQAVSPFSVPHLAPLLPSSSGEPGTKPSQRRLGVQAARPCTGRRRWWCWGGEGWGEKGRGAFVRGGGVWFSLSRREERDTDARQREDRRDLARKCYFCFSQPSMVLSSEKAGRGGGVAATAAAAEGAAAQAPALLLVSSKGLVKSDCCT